MIDRPLHWIKTAVVKEDFLYCVDNLYSILYRINICSWEIEKIATLKWDKQGIVTDVFEIDGRIVCVPLNGIQIAVYDLKSGNVIYAMSGIDIWELIDIVIYDHKIWFVPRNLPGKLYYYSLGENKFMEDHIWEEEAERIGLNGRIKRKCYIEDNKIYIIDGERIVKYNLENHCMKEVENPLNKSCVDITRIGDTYYCIAEDDKRKIFYWNVKDKQVFWQESVGNNEYVKITRAGEIAFLDAVSEIDILANGKIKRWEHSDIDNLESSNYISIVKYFDKWILLPWGSAAFIECSSDFTGIKKCKIMIPIEDILEREMCFLEPEILLNDYMTRIIQNRKKLSYDSAKRCNGQVIYEKFKR